MDLLSLILPAKLQLDHSSLEPEPRTDTFKHKPWSQSLELTAFGLGAKALA